MTARRLIVVLLALTAAVAVAIFVAAHFFVTVVPRSPNILLISVDTLRADRLGCYGCSAGKTPHIDALAAQGALFSQCTTAAPITLPSHASLLTGTYPFVHGARDNGFFHLHPNNETLAEQLKAVGYKTAGIVSAFVLNREFGLSQGFDTYDDMHAESITNAATAEFNERSAEQTADLAMRRLGELAGDKPWFLFVHFFDPHFPYEAPPRFLQQYADGYLAEIAYVDEQIGRILALLHERGLDRSTLIVLTADHGEGKGDHNEESHAGFVYDSTLSVPLIISQPGRIPAAKRIAAQVRTIDVMPTILSATPTGRIPPTVQGVDLEPLMNGTTTDLGLAAYGESFYSRFNYGYAALRTLRSDGWKYIHAPTPELYDLRHDPGELFNLAAKEPQRVKAFRDQLKDLLDSASVVTSAQQAQQQLSPQAIKSLQSLGYAGGGGAATTSPAEAIESLEFLGPDPKDHVVEMGLMDRALALLRSGNLSEAESALRQVIARSAEQKAAMPWAHANLGSVLAAQGRFDDAASHYEQALALRPTDGRLWGNLGLAYLKLNRIDDAIRAFDTARSHPPVFAYTYVDLARAIERNQQFVSARDVLRAGMTAFPDDREIPRALVWLLATCPDDAVRAGKEALRLATTLRGATLAPTATVLDALAAAQAEIGDFAAAVRTAEQALDAARRAGQTELSSAIAARIEMYRANKPYRTER